MQDYSSLRGPSQSLSGFGSTEPVDHDGGVRDRLEHPDPVDPDIGWGGCYAGVVGAHEHADRARPHG